MEFAAIEISEELKIFLYFVAAIAIFAIDMISGANRMAREDAEHKPDPYIQTLFGQESGEPAASDRDAQPKS